jgi:hypothetical protein
MKKILLALLTLGLLFTGCTKQPFKEKKPEAKAALVYTYVVEDDGVNDTDRYPCYKVHLGEEYTNDCMNVGEYMAFDVKPGKVDFNIARANIEIQTIAFNLSAGETKYLRIQSFSDDFAKFNVVDTEASKALKELKHTTLVGSYVKKETGPSKLITPKEESRVVSKSDELEKAYKLKEKGILSEEEFNKLKSEILAK